MSECIMHAIDGIQSSRRNMTDIIRGCDVNEQTLRGSFFSMSRICDKKRSKPKIFLAFLSKLFCFSFIL